MEEARAKEREIRRKKDERCGLAPFVGKNMVGLPVWPEKMVEGRERREKREREK